MRLHRLIFAGALGLFGAALGRDAMDDWVEATVLPPLIVETGTEALDREGRLLRAWTVEDGRWRLRTSVETVDPAFLEMLIAYEDRRFHRHSGVDLRAMARAVAQAVWHGRVVSGGSTLTMQVARLLEGSGTGRMRGKLRQIRVALALERALSKPEILDIYLHLAPYGGNIEGLRAASLTWFGKEPRRLTPAQSALLVALPQAPESRRPDRHPEAAQMARDRVLGRAARFADLPAEAVEAARLQPVPETRQPFPAIAPHLTDRLRAQTPGADVVTSHLDADLQTALETLATRATHDQADAVQIAITVMDHATGQGLASVGSQAYDADAQGYVDFTQAVRSPGSALKPFVYGLAFDAGLIHPETLIGDRPMRFGTYAPQNFDRQYRGSISVRGALQASLNLPVVAVLDRLGPARLIAGIERAGVTPQLQGAPGLAVGLGGLGVTLEDLVQLYGGLAQSGRVHPLHHTGAAPEMRDLMAPQAAWQVANILADIPPPAHAPRGRVAFKTGTSYGHRDAWAIGFDGAHVVGVWMGRADGTPVPGAFGADLAAPLLFEVFARISPKRVALPPPPRGTLLVAGAQLPPRLRHFEPPTQTSTPRIAFPLDGAVLELQPDLPLIPRVQEGQPPYAWLINDAPVATNQALHTVDLGLQNPGFVTITVIDAAGRAARAHVELREP